MAMKLRASRHKTRPWDVRNILEEATCVEPQMKDLYDKSLRRDYMRMCDIDKGEELNKKRIPWGNGLPFVNEVLDDQHLEELKKMFKESKMQCLSKEEMKNWFDQNIQDRQVMNNFDKIFNLIDLDLDGLVSWSELICYLEMEMMARYEAVNGYVPTAITEIDEPAREIPNRHRQLIVAILFYRSVNRERKVEPGVGKYIIVSHRGHVDFLNLDLEPLYHRTTTCPWPYQLKTELRTACVLPEINILCLGGMCRDLQFYDLSNERFDLVYHIQNLESHPVVMEYKFYEDPKKCSFIAIGGVAGNVTAILFRTDDGGPFKCQFGNPHTTVTYQDIRTGNVPGMEVREFGKLHKSWVESIKYSEPQDCILTTSRCYPVSLAIINVSELCVLAVLQTPLGFSCAEFLPPPKADSTMPLTGFQKSETEGSKKVFRTWVVTGGLDCRVRVWDLNEPKTPRFSLAGHVSEIRIVMVQSNPYMEDPLVLSYGILGLLFFWNGRTFEKIYMYQAVMADLPAHVPLSYCYNSHSNNLILGAYHIYKIRLGKAQDSFSNSGCSHEVTALLLNTVYNFIITTTLGSMIQRWNPVTGKVELIIWKAHTSDFVWGEDTHGIAHAVFNPQQNVLATGAVDGSIKMWDCYRGVAMRTMHIPGPVRWLYWKEYGLLGVTTDGKVRQFSGSTKASEDFRDISLEVDFPASATAFLSPSFLLVGTVGSELAFSDFATGRVIRLESTQNTTGRIAGAGPSCGASSFRVSGRNEIFCRNDFLHSGSSGRTTVECIYVLEKRAADKKCGNVLVALDSGVIQFWSSHEEGGFITSFYCTHKDTDKVVSMTSDLENNFLFTGTAQGYLKTWHITGYGQGAVEDVPPPKGIKFPFFSKDVRGSEAWTSAEREKNIPRLLNSFLAHAGAIGYIIYLDAAQIVITSSQKWVSFWTLTGQLINELGAATWAPMNLSEPTELIECKVPLGLRRLASPSSLKILKKEYRFQETDLEEDKMQREYKERERVLSRSTKLTPYGQPLDTKKLEEIFGLNKYTVDQVERLPDLDKENLFQNLPFFKTEKVTWIKPPKIIRSKRKRLELSILHNGNTKCLECEKEMDSPDRAFPYETGISLKEGVNVRRKELKEKEQRELCKDCYWKKKKMKESQNMDSPFSADLLGTTTPEIADIFGCLNKAAADQEFGQTKLFGKVVPRSPEELQEFIAKAIESKRIEDTPKNRKLLENLIKLEKKKSILKEIKELAGQREDNLLSINCFTKNEKIELVNKTADIGKAYPAAKKNEIPRVYSLITDCLYETEYMSASDDDLLNLLMDLAKPLKDTDPEDKSHVGYKKRFEWWNKHVGNKIPALGCMRQKNSGLTEFVRDLTADKDPLSELQKPELYDRVNKYLMKTLKGGKCLDCGEGILRAEDGGAGKGRGEPVPTLPKLTLRKRLPFPVTLTSCLVKAGVASGKAMDDPVKSLQEFLRDFAVAAFPLCESCHGKKRFSAGGKTIRQKGPNIVKAFSRAIEFNRPKDLPEEEKVTRDYRIAAQYFSQNAKIDKMRKEDNIYKERDINITKYEKRLIQIRKELVFSGAKEQVRRQRRSEIIKEIKATENKINEEMRRYKQ